MFQPDHILVDMYIAIHVASMADTIPAPAIIVDRANKGGECDPPGNIDAQHEIPVNEPLQSLIEPDRRLDDRVAAVSVGVEVNVIRAQTFAPGEDVPPIVLQNIIVPHHTQPSVGCRQSPLLHEDDHIAQVVLYPDIIAIKIEYVGRCREIQSTIPRGRNAPVLLPHIPDPLVALVGFQYFGRIVGATIIYP